MSFSPHFLNSRWLLLITVGIIPSFLLYGQTFPCDGSLYLSQNNNRPPTILNKIILDSSNAVQFEKVSEYNSELNALAFNRSDQYIYAFEKGSKAIVQLSSNGTYKVMGNAVGYPGRNAASGTMTENGIYILQDRTGEMLHFYQIQPQFKKLAEVKLVWANGSGNSGVCDVDFDDFVVDRNDANRLITYQRNYPKGAEPANTRGALLGINIDINSPAFGEVAVIGYVPEDVILQMGAMFYGNDGLLYAYGSQEANINQRNLVSINVQQPSRSFYVAQGPSSKATDGCSCPVNIRITKAIDEYYQICNNIFVKYSFSIINESVEDFINLNFDDPLQFGGRFADSLNNAQLINGSFAELLNNNSRLSIPGFSLNALDSLSFTAWVSYPAQVGIISNQAKISGFTSLIGSEVLSDDPSTEEINDSTSFFINDEQVRRHYIDTAICHNSILSLNGTSYDQSGTYQQILDNASVEGCDSIIDIQLTVLDPVEEFKEVEICYDEVYNFNGNSLSSSGVYIDTLISRSGCDSIVELNLNKRPPLQITGPAQHIIDNCTILQADLSTNFEHDSIVWTPSMGLSCSDCLNPVISIENDLTYTVTVFDAIGCNDQFSIDIEAQGDASKADVYIPNIFTPHNKDELNDHFTLFSSQCISLIEEFRIFDRWGSLVFEARNIPPNIPELGWNGRFNGSDAPLSTYVFYFKVRYFDGGVNEIYGDVTLN